MSRNLYDQPERDKKYQNLLNNAHISLLIDTRGDHVGRDRHNVKALTVRGVFQNIEDELKKTKILEKLLDRHPQLRAFAGNPEVEIFLVKIMSFELLEGVSNAYYVEVG